MNGIAADHILFILFIHVDVRMETERFWRLALPVSPGTGSPT
jgi:hypothetical protein